MGFLDDAENLAENSGVLDSGMQQAGQELDQATGGQFNTEIQQGEQAAESQFGGGGNQGGFDDQSQQDSGSDNQF